MQKAYIIFAFLVLLSGLFAVNAMAQTTNRGKANQNMSKIKTTVLNRPPAGHPYLLYPIYSDGLVQITMGGQWNFDGAYSNDNTTPTVNVAVIGKFPSRVDIGDVTVNNLVFHYLGEVEGHQPVGMVPPVEDYYGSKVSFTCKDEGTQYFQDSMYVPTIIKINNSAEKGGIIKTGTGGFNITWNADGQNKNGIVIIVTYTDMYDAPHKDESVRNILFAPDNGHATITPELLHGVRAGMPIRLQIARGNIKTEKAKGKIIKLEASTSSGIYFTIDEN